TTLPTSIRRSELGSPAVHAGTFTSRPRMHPGSTRWNASSHSSPNARSVVAHSCPLPTLSRRSTTSFALTMQIHSPSYGPLMLIQPFRNSLDCVSEFPGQNTSSGRPQERRADGGAHRAGNRVGPAPEAVAFRCQCPVVGCASVVQGAGVGCSGDGASRTD